MKIFLKILLIMVIIIGLLIFKVNANIEETIEYKARTYIDYPSEILVPDVKEIMRINGWYMSNDSQAKIKVYIDDEEKDMEELKKILSPDIL